VALLLLIFIMCPCLPITPCFQIFFQNRDFKIDVLRQTANHKVSWRNCSVGLTFRFAVKRQFPAIWGYCIKGANSTPKNGVRKANSPILVHNVIILRRRRFRTIWLIFSDFLTECTQFNKSNIVVHFNKIWINTIIYKNINVHTNSDQSKCVDVQLFIICQLRNVWNVLYSYEIKQE
jgi:hypothetical protein